jgi:hypothetical protein
VRESIDPRDQFSVTLRLYEGPESYRVYELLSPLSPRPPYDASLYPVVGHWGYRTYTEDEAREKWGQYFEALSAWARRGFLALIRPYAVLHAGYEPRDQPY